MAQTFGEYLLRRRIDRRTANPELLQRIQTTPGMGEVTTFGELLETVGTLSPAEEFTIKGLWRSYRATLRVTSRRRDGG